MNNNTNLEPVVGAQAQPVVAPATPVVPTMPAIDPNQQVVNQTNVVPQQQVIQQVPVQNTLVEQPQVDPSGQELQIQSQLQAIPTVEQDKQAFIDNVQSMNTEKAEEKKEGVNFVFIGILFAVLLAAIFFLFPVLVDYI